MGWASKAVAMAQHVYVEDYYSNKQNVLDHFRLMGDKGRLGGL